MSDTSRVLVVVDPAKDAKQTSVQRGAMLAEKLGLGIELLIVHTDREFTDLRVKNPKGWDRARHQIVNAHGDHLEGISALLEARGLDVLFSVTCDWPLDEGITRHALYTAPKLVIYETHVHSKINRVLIGHTDWNLIRNCPAPLWLAKAGNWNNRAPVLACINPAYDNNRYATLDEEILLAARELAGKVAGSTHVFSAFPPLRPTGLSKFLDGDEEDLDAKYSNSHRLLLDRLVDENQIEATNTHTPVGLPEKELPLAAEHTKASVVVMGAIARNLLDRAIIGSTAEKVLDQIKADVLIIKPCWFKSPVNALSHADFKNDPQGRIFRVKPNSRKEWAGYKMATQA